MLRTDGLMFLCAFCFQSKLPSVNKVLAEKLAAQQGADFKQSKVSIECVQFILCYCSSSILPVTKL